ncbi:MAG TPA: hypothetical protein VNZ22_00780 [Bacillota bacterium]|nr:hypothetical protein [Bacillota bacterium]
MKAIKSARLILTLGLALLSSSAMAQMWTNMWSTNSFCTNFTSSGWWTNTAMMTNLPAMQFTNHFSMVMPSWMTNSASGFTNYMVSGDTKVLLQQFQAAREAIIKQYNGMSQEQRQALLQQLQAVREQLQTQLTTMREQAKDQAESMKQRFHDDRSRLLNQGVGSSGGSRGRD